LTFDPEFVAFYGEGQQIRKWSIDVTPKIVVVLSTGVPRYEFVAPTQSPRDDVLFGLCHIVRRVVLVEETATVDAMAHRSDSLQPYHSSRLNREGGALDLRAAHRFPQDLLDSGGAELLHLGVDALAVG
jgi:hypothetical protein